MNMPKPTPQSVTDVECKCGYLQRTSDRPELPIVYDEATNEFHFTWPSQSGGEPNALMIYHCPFCGGTAPESKRATLFAVVSDAEAKRLNELLGEIKSLDDAIEKLGPPDRDSPVGASIEMPEKDGRPPTRRYFRTLTYTSLSNTADVELAVYREGRVQITFVGKYRGPG
jgi:hypothetical protein